MPAESDTKCNLSQEEWCLVCRARMYEWFGADKCTECPPPPATSTDALELLDSDLTEQSSEEGLDKSEEVCLLCGEPIPCRCTERIEAIMPPTRRMTMDNDAAEMAEWFHYTYERLAPEYGYETRGDTREFDTLSANGQLMVAVCTEWLARRRDAE